MRRGPKSEVAESKHQWRDLFERPCGLKAKKKRGEDVTFRKEVRWCLMANYPPFIARLAQLNTRNGVEKPVAKLDVKKTVTDDEASRIAEDILKARALIYYDPDWRVQYRQDQYDSALWSFFVVDPPPVLSIAFYKGSGIIGLTSHFITSEWYDASIDLRAPLDDLNSALEREKLYWHEVTGVPLPKPGRPKKEDLGFFDEKDFLPVEKIERSGQMGAVLHAKIRISAHLKPLQIALEKLIAAEQLPRRSGRKARFTPDLDNLEILKTYCASKKVARTVAKRSKAAEKLPSGGKIRTNIEALLEFVDPNNIGGYPDHPLAPRAKRSYNKDQVPPRRPLSGDHGGTE